MGTGVSMTLMRLSSRKSPVPILNRSSAIAPVSSLPVASSMAETYINNVDRTREIDKELKREKIRKLGAVRLLLLGKYA